MKKFKPLSQVKSVCHSCTTRSNPEYVQKLAQRGVTSFSMDAIPRISRLRAWTYSASGQLAGYKAVILVQNKWPKFSLDDDCCHPLPLQRYWSLGRGLTGHCHRQKTWSSCEANWRGRKPKEQAESLAQIYYRKDDGVKAEGGYAKEVTCRVLCQTKEAVNKSLFQADRNHHRAGDGERPLFCYYRRTSKNSEIRFCHSWYGCQNRVATASWAELNKVV